MDFKLNLSDKEFEQLMKTIDERMMSENVKVQGRQIRGWMLFCESLQLHGLSFTHPISQKVMQWFQTRYGDRLNLDFTLGHFVEILRGDLFRARCVLFFGELHLICSFPVMGHSQKRPLNQPALLNVLDFVEGMTPSFAKELASRESQALLRGFTTAYVHFARIADLPPLPFVSEARGDLREAVEHMFRPEPQFGSSKWSSLQAAEKFLKAYIQQKRGKPKHIHFLEELACDAERLGLRAIDRKVLDRAQCPPSARYDSKSVTPEEALDAYRAAIEIAGTVALPLSPPIRIGG
jgi:HEPN domain